MIANHFTVPAIVIGRCRHAPVAGRWNIRFCKSFGVKGQVGSFRWTGLFGPCIDWVPNLGVPGPR
jgi:hypothetical protein